MEYMHLAHREGRNKREEREVAVMFVLADRARKEGSGTNSNDDS
jgi:hypothetical protein